MNKLKVMLSVFVFALAAVTAVTTTAGEKFSVQLWEKSSNSCVPSTCMDSGSLSCGSSSFTYHTDEECKSAAITPRRN